LTDLYQIKNLKLILSAHEKTRYNHLELDTVSVWVKRSHFVSVSTVLLRRNEETVMFAKDICRLLNKHLQFLFKQNVFLLSYVMKGFTVP